MDRPGFCVDFVTAPPLTTPPLRRQVMAVMGPTGCGKTTFLSALGNRLDPSIVMTGESKISWGGQPWSAALKRCVGFIEQDGK